MPRLSAPWLNLRGRPLWMAAWSLTWMVERSPEAPA